MVVYQCNVSLQCSQRNIERAEICLQLIGPERLQCWWDRFASLIFEVAFPLLLSNKFLSVMIQFWIDNVPGNQILLGIHKKH